METNGLCMPLSVILSCMCGNISSQMVDGNKLLKPKLCKGYFFRQKENL